jgi:hypothetical protein
VAARGQRLARVVAESDQVSQLVQSKGGSRDQGGEP